MIRFLIAFLLLATAAVAAPNTTQVPLTLEITTCSAHAPIAGNGSGSSPLCDTLSAMIDSAFTSTQGSLLYRGASTWTGLAPGTSGFFLETLGGGANPTWAAATGSSGCSVGAGSNGNVLVNNGSSGCSTDTNVLFSVGALTLGASGTAGSVKMGNATTGTVTIQPVAGALGTVTASLAANTGTIAELNLAQGWTAAQTFTNSDILLLGSSTGATTFASANSSASNFTLTFPAVTDTLAVLGTAQTWLAVQTYTNSDIAILGSSTGKTTLTSANAGASNFTITIPAATDTLAVLGTAQTFTAAKTFNNSDIILLGSSTGGTTFSSGNSSATNYTATFPANTGTVAETNFATTWSGAQTFTNADLLMAGSTSGTTTLEASATASGVATFPANTGTVAETNLAQTFSAVQTFQNSDIVLLGSSTGGTTFSSANSGASSFTLTFPAVTDTIATLNTASQVMAGGVHLTSFSIGTVSSGTSTINCGNNPSQYLTNGGAFTLAAPANDSQCIVQITNNASAGTVTFSGFTVGSNTGAALDTINGHVFSIFIWRVNGTSAYSVYANQ